MHFESREDEIIFICKNQAGRRNLTPEQLSYLRGQAYEATKVKEARNREGSNQYKKEDRDQNELKPTGPNTTAKLISKQYSVGQATVRRDARFAKAVDTIGDAAPETRQKILSGEIAAPKKQIVEIAEKPEPERRAM